MRDGWVQVLLFFVSVCVGAAAARADAAGISPCKGRQFGNDTGVVRYQGTVTNGDYLFNVTIPAGLVGYGNAPGAPFHGFRIFLDDHADARSCVLFYIGLSMADVFQYDTEQIDTKKQRMPGRTVAIGNRNGRAEKSVRKVGGEAWQVTEVWLELPRGSSTNMLRVEFFRKQKDSLRKADEERFEAFLSSFRFE